MAKTLDKSGIITGQTITAAEISQSIDAFTGTEAYDITLSGSLSVTGPTTLTGTTSGSFQGDGSGLTGVVSSSFASTATSASFASTATSATSASYAATASFLSGFVTSASYAVTSSFAQSGDGTFSGSFSGSFEGDGSGITGVVSSSFALTASYIQADNIDQPFTNITASSNISSSGTVYGVTGSFSHLVGNSPITVSSPVISQLNNTKLVEVENSSSFPTTVGTQITLEEHTTYLIRGNVNMSDTLFVSGSGISLIGLDRNLDTLTYTSSSVFLTVEDSDFTIRDLKFSATNTSSILISGSDYTSGSFNQGRAKVFEINNSQFRNCGNVADFKGYDLIDINNTLFYYIQAPTIGLKFTDTAKTEISSCEFIR